MTKKLSPIVFVVFVLALVTLACSGSKAARQAVDVPSSSQVAKAIDLPVSEEEETGATWHEFSSVDGNFTALFPVEPEEQVQKAPNAIVETEVHLFMADLGAAAYMVAYNDLPAAITPDMADSEAVESSFDSLHETFLAGFGGTSTQEEAIDLAGYPGRQIEFTVGDSVLPGGGFGTVRVYAVATRLYQVAALGTPDALSNEDVDTFLNSFALLETPISEPEASIITETDVVAVADTITQAEPVEAVEAVIEVEPVEAEAVTEGAEVVVEEREAVDTTTTIEQPVEVVAEAAPVETYETDFPLPTVVQNFYIEETPYQQVNFQTDLTLDEALAFYREAFAAQGLTERTLLTNIVEGTAFSLVFDGSANGLALVIQAVPIGEVTNINIRYEPV
ncbi:MAG: hypothetical protein KDJ52_04810 [Anaerolineae bacterium]|nr:hypothetical protein [Anaerolineae bacterium]